MSGLRRGYALVSLAAISLLFIALVTFLLRSPQEVLLGLVGLGVAAAGAWWVATEQMPRRAIGVVGVVVGLVLIAATLIGAVQEMERAVIQIVSVIILLGISTVAARAALVRDLHQISISIPTPTVPKRPVLLCNPWSGGGKVEKFGLLEVAESLGVRTVLLDHGLDLEQLARDEVRNGADCLGMAGGDGSQALVASIAVEHDLPFVCISAGTRNHFALDLGLNRDDPRETMNAFRDAIERRIDFATVNGRFFVNNVSLGVYATIVQEHGYREEKALTTRTLLPELLGRQAEPFDLQFTDPNGTDVDGAFVIQVSNNPYVIGASFDNAQRHRMDTSQLGVVAITASTGAEAARMLTRTAIGQRQRSRFWHEFACEEFEVRSRSGRAYAGIDGEALDLETPLHFRIHPSGLRLLVPADNLQAAEQRRARNVSVKRLLAVAAGRDSGLG